ncbi:hypothetical protein ACEWY4_018899 [Coilia grayii]|uniref:C-type lectin domain-containing protein n=1 Tax=Coilia grayii TaxID=363190 RepID=A0ABD1JEH3_9TELE
MHIYTEHIFFLGFPFTSWSILAHPGILSETLSSTGVSEELPSPATIMGVLHVLSLLYTVFAVTMATEAMTDGDSAEMNIQLSSDEAAEGVQARSTCDSGWTLYENRCFRLFNLPRTWALAEAYCITQRGHLASAHSIAEARFMGTLSGNRLWTWIGGVQTLV